MGFAFANYRENACCLCGSVEKLSGEHKIKASTLRAEFGSEKFVIVPFDNPAASRNVQGPKSKEFHFKSGICETCNNVRTQKADTEFSFCCEMARGFIDAGDDPMTIFQDRRYQIKSSFYLNLHRYFAKLLCCHMADSRAPRSRRMSNFAIGRSDANCVSIHIDQDVDDMNLSRSPENLPFVSHGGLVVYTDKKTLSANAFHSTRSIGSLRFVFHSRMNWLEKNELSFLYKDFKKLHSEAVKNEFDAPMKSKQLDQLGL